MLRIRWLSVAEAAATLREWAAYSGGSVFASFDQRLG